MTLDLETRVLNDLDEKLHGLISISIDSPKLIKMVYDTPRMKSLKKFPMLTTFYSCAPTLIT